MPASLLRSNESITALVKGHQAGSSKCALGTVGPPGLNRIKPLLAKLSALKGGLACLSEANGVARAQAHLSLAIAIGKAENPALVDAVNALFDLQIEATAICKKPWLFDSPDLE
jgi:hypothetical protein